MVVGLDRYFPSSLDHFSLFVYFHDPVYDQFPRILLRAGIVEAGPQPHFRLEGILGDGVYPDDGGLPAVLPAFDDLGYHLVKEAHCWAP